MAGTLTLTIDSNEKPASLKKGGLLLPSAHPSPDRSAIDRGPTQIHR
jgi:hypothetical protein